jgi:L-asparagine transporter-like permease
MVVGSVTEFNGRGIPTIDAAFEAVVLTPALSTPVLAEWLNGVFLKNNPNIIFIKQ